MLLIHLFLQAFEFQTLKDNLYFTFLCLNRVPRLCLNYHHRILISFTLSEEQDLSIGEKYFSFDNESMLTYIIVHDQYCKTYFALTKLSSNYGKFLCNI